MYTEVLYDQRNIDIGFKWLQIEHSVSKLALKRITSVLMNILQTMFIVIDIYIDKRGIHSQEDAYRDWKTEKQGTTENSTVNPGPEMTEATDEESSSGPLSVCGSDTMVQTDPHHSHLPKWTFYQFFRKGSQAHCTEMALCLAGWRRKRIVMLVILSVFLSKGCDLRPGLSRSIKVTVEALLGGTCCVGQLCLVTRQFHRSYVKTVEDSLVVSFFFL